MEAALIVLVLLVGFATGCFFNPDPNLELLERKRYRNNCQRSRPSPLPVPQIPVPGFDQTPRYWSMMIEPSVDRLNTVITVKGIWHELPPKELGEFLAKTGEYLQGIE